MHFYIVEGCKMSPVNPLTYVNYVLSNVRDKRVTLLTPDELTDANIT
jgi:hypothetical protein